MDDDIGAPSPVVARSATYESLLEPLLPLAYRVAYWLTGADTEAQAVLHDTVRRARRRFDSLSGNFKCGFLQILARRSYTWNQTKKRKRNAGVARAAVDPHPDAVSRAVAELPTALRVASVLYFLDELTCADLAAILECPASTARRRLHRGRAILRQALGHASPYEPLGPGPRRKTGNRATRAAIVRW